MSRDRVNAFKHVIQTWRDAGLPDHRIAETVSALRDGTTPDELDTALANDFTNE